MLGLFLGPQHILLRLISKQLYVQNIMCLSNFNLPKALARGWAFYHAESKLADRKPWRCGSLTGPLPLPSQPAKSFLFDPSIICTQNKTRNIDRFEIEVETDIGRQSLVLERSVLCFETIRIFFSEIMHADRSSFLLFIHNVGSTQSTRNFFYSLVLATCS